MRLIRHYIQESILYRPKSIIFGSLDKSTQLKNIFLIGMPGVGKSYWAERIAAHFGLHCIDLDHMIEVRCRRRIADIFRQFGEQRFRMLEAQTLQQIITVFPNGLVVACGGGTPCYHNNMKLMQQKGLVVYLQADLPLLLERLEADDQARPLLQTGNKQVQLATLLQQREAIYAQAQCTLNSAQISIDSFEPIISLCRNQAH